VCLRPPSWKSLRIMAGFLVIAFDFSMLILLALLIPLCTIFFGGLSCMVGNFVLSDSYMHQSMQKLEY
jgi:hypothetical protein